MLTGLRLCAKAQLKSLGSQHSPLPVGMGSGPKISDKEWDEPSMAVRRKRALYACSAVRERWAVVLRALPFCSSTGFDRAHLLDGRVARKVGVVGVCIEGGHHPYRAPPAELAAEGLGGTCCPPHRGRSSRQTSATRAEEAGGRELPSKSMAGRVEQMHQVAGVGLPGTQARCAHDSSAPSIDGEVVDDEDDAAVDQVTG